MKVTKARALELIDGKISQFQEILANATYNNYYDEDYQLAYHGMETLLSELFSKEETMNFRSNVSSVIAFILEETDYAGTTKL